MSNAIRIIFYAILMWAFSTSDINAQKHIEQANSFYDKGAYELAIPSYKEALQDDPGNVEVTGKLATCYKNIGDYISTIRAYESIVKSQGQLPAELQMDYGHALKKVGLYDKAQKVYWNYKPNDPAQAEHFALGCDYAMNMLEESDKYEISLFKYNSKRSDFGTSFYKDKIVFASFRDNTAQEDAYKLGNQLYIENVSNDGITQLGEPSKNLEGFGPLSYSRDAKMVAYTKNSIADGGNHINSQSERMEVYYAITNSDGSFKNENPFPFNGAEYSTAFPQLSFNGNALYFASTMPGGYGGYDLYVSHFKNGKWSKPENLGKSINTPGNEITPFFDGLYLYYSTDYSHGLGGFDIYTTKLTDGKWAYGENMGNGVNSPSDDYYFMVNPDSGEMFFTSNRLGGRGKDDIYVAREYEIIEYAYENVDEEDNVYIPKAVSLGDLSPVSHTKPKQNSSDIVVVNLPVKEEARKSDSRAIPVNDKVEIKLIDNLPAESTVSEDVSLFGARKIAMGEVFNTKSGVFFIQLAALSSSRGNVDQFRNLVQYGNLYKVYHTSFTKIKLGYYLDRQEATEVLNSIKNMGYTDAFITFETLDSEDMELVASPYEENDYQENSFDYVQQSKYKVRLGSYSDPLWFDTSKVKDIGKIEQWSKGSWTIFILSGFSDLEGAQSAMIQAQNRGFRDAEIVLDNNGILERLKQN